MALYKVDSDTADLTKVAGGTLYADNPIGSIIPYGGANAPSGWLLCQGQELTKTEYADLYAVIGDSFGTASANTKFKLPDLRGRATMGVASGHTLGTSENDATAVKGLSVATTVNSKTLEGSFKPYSPSGAGGDYPNVGNMTVSGIFGKGTASTTGYVPAVTPIVGKSYPLTVDASHKHTASSTLSSTDTETRPKNVRVNYIIKAKQTPVPADFMDAVEEAIDTSNIAKMLPYSFNTTSNIGAFNRQFVYQGHVLTWTATHTGRLTLRLLKHGDGYSLYLRNQNGMLDTYDNFFGSDSQGTGVSDASITLSAYVKKGDVIRLESNLPSTTAWADMFFCQTGLLAYNNNYD